MDLVLPPGHVGSMCCMFLMQVDTYDVIPVSSALGMVAFVPGTRPLIDAFCLSESFLTAQLEQQGAMIRKLAKPKSEVC